MPTRNVNLTTHYDSFIDTSIATGRFSNASETVRAGLHLLELQEAEDRAKIEWLRDTTKEAFAALDRGEGISFASMDELAGHIRQLGREASTAKRTGKRRA